MKQSLLTSFVLRIANNDEDKWKYEVIHNNKVVRESEYIMNNETEATIRAKNRLIMYISNSLQ